MSPFLWVIRISGNIRHSGPAPLFRTQTSFRSFVSFQWIQLRDSLLVDPGKRLSVGDKKTRKEAVWSS